MESIRYLISDYPGVRTPAYVPAHAMCTRAFLLLLKGLGMRLVCDVRISVQLPYMNQIIGTLASLGDTCTKQWHF